MRKTISKYLFYFYQQFINKDNKLYYLKKFRNTQWNDAETVVNYQKKRLVELLKHTQLRSGYYRKLFKQIGLTPAQFDYPQDLVKIPPLDKDIIRKRKKDLLCEKPSSGFVVPNSTSGSTGEATFFFSDKRAEAIKAPLVLRNYEWLDIGIGSRELRIWGAHFDVNNAKKIKQRLLNYIKNRFILSSYEMRNGNIPQILETVEQLRPDFIFSYPSTLFHIAEYSQHRKIRLAFRPKVVITSGEQLHQWQKESIESFFGATVFNFYGCREVGSIAQECLYREGMHVISENVIVEVVDVSGHPVIGKEGDILVTDLNNRVMPFIRYRIGDRGRILERSCDCGRTGFPLIDVFGRSFDIIRSPQGDAVGGTFWTLLFRSKPGIRRFRVIQEQLGEVHIDYVSEDGNDLPQETIDNYSNEIQDRLKGLKVCFQHVNTIPALDSGKQQFVFNRISS